MNLTDINKKYFTPGTRGYKILSYFYNKYSDLFNKTVYTNFEAFLNQIFLSVSNIDFTKDIRNEEAYIIGTIKIQCRVLLDKALKFKREVPESLLNELNNENSEDSIINNLTANKKEEQLAHLEAEEFFNCINTFKTHLSVSEVKLLNNLIDEKTRFEIAEETNIKLNTLDTHIRRLRIKFSKFLKNSGYTDKILNKYDKD